MQVLALCHYPALITDPNASKAFAPDAIARAKLYLSHIAGTGAYTTSQGIKIVTTTTIHGMDWTREGEQGSGSGIGSGRCPVSCRVNVSAFPYAC